MSVLVKNMMMPECCLTCPMAKCLYDGDELRLACLVLGEWASEDCRLDICPLSEVPDKCDRCRFTFFEKGEEDDGQ